ncbi:hypothetical protein HPB52_016518 [Rhipicephalus sanguineus]|uniref:Uncharacterized protein n=1 Tax=Rhipicephalus sanguineus TaxID=34632 RepID=A0A9D4Q104_RHISA|nr:hypothetical protein HPB52_016518 [Rhipicephalus sanguineus]
MRVGSESAAVGEPGANGMARRGPGGRAGFRLRADKKGRTFECAQQPASSKGPRRSRLEPRVETPCRTFGQSSRAHPSSVHSNDSLEVMDTSRSLLLSLAALALLGSSEGREAAWRWPRGWRPELAEDEEYTALPGALEAFEWRSRFPPAAPADISSFYPFFRPTSLAKKNKDAPRSIDPAGAANRKFQTQGWRR